MEEKAARIVITSMEGTSDAAVFLSDEAIAARVQQGEREAFGVLVERYEKKMTRYATKFLFGYVDAGDLVQDTFLKAYANILRAVDK